MALSSIKANAKELNVLVDKQKPVAVYLQETFLKILTHLHLDITPVSLKTSDNDRGSVGVAITVNNSIPHHRIKLETTLQAVAVNISLNKTITLCSVYLSPPPPPPPQSLPIDVKKLDHLIDQLPEPFILMGDFNAHHTLWGCIDTNDKGRIIEDFVTKHDLVLNEKSSTYLSSSCYRFLFIFRPYYMQPWNFSRL